MSSPTSTYAVNYDLIPVPSKHNLSEELKLSDIESGVVKSQVTSFKMKPKQDIAWRNVNFKVKDKNILKECWGTVRLF